MPRLVEVRVVFGGAGIKASVEGSSEADRIAATRRRADFDSVSGMMKRSNKQAIIMITLVVVY
jgi:hypothetical protein